MNSQEAEEYRIERRKRLRDVLAEVKAALEGDTNDAEHDALVSVAEFFEVDYTPPEF